MEVDTGPRVALQHLDRYLDSFRGAFGRRERFRWARLYVEALLRTAERKNIANLARNLTLPADFAAEDVVQALQNFISQSPWDEQRLWRTHWARLAAHAGEADAAFVIGDVTFEKRGQQSVGVQRQYSAELGKKVNCQIAVAVYYAHARRLWPLALRLYLPRNWIQDPARLHAAGVPRAFAVSRSKGQIALDLLDAVRAEGVRARRVVADPPYDSSHELQRGLRERGLVYHPGLADETADAGSSIAPTAVRRAPRGDHLLERVRRTCRRLKDELGLDHFEGRSWRGFHHHACLVVLAYSFLLEDHHRTRRDALA